ncbi:MAG: hypothetical protein MHMPM18_003702 [Marteilia pararefringens]
MLVEAPAAVGFVRSFMLLSLATPLITSSLLLLLFVLQEASDASDKNDAENIKTPSVLLQAITQI